MQADGFWGGVNGAQNHEEIWFWQKKFTKIDDNLGV